MKSLILLAIVVLIALLVSVGHSQTLQDQCPAYLELMKSMVAERDVTVEIQKRQIAALQAKIAEKEKVDAPKEGK